MNMYMTPIRRMVHSKIWDSDQVALLRPIEALLYIGMITLGDDYGRLRGDARFLNARIFPYRKVSDRQVEQMRDRITEVGLITVYSDEKAIYIRHPNWERHQTLRPDKLKVSQFPAPPNDVCPSQDGRTTAEVKRSEAKTMEDKLSEAMGVDARSAMLAGMPNNGEGTMFAHKLHPLSQE